MFITSAINLKAGIITGMIIGGAIAVAAKQLIENQGCVSKCSNKFANTSEKVEDSQEHSKN